MAGFNLGDVVAHLKLEIGEFTNSLNDARAQLQNTSSSMQSLGKVSDTFTSVGKTLTASVTAPIMGLGAAAVKMTSDFNSSMAKVQALSGATGEELQLLRDTAKEMGATTQYSATEAADALGYMALAGWDANESTKALPGVLNLAAASGMDLAQASDLCTDYMSAFGMEAGEAGRMADVLAKAQATSNTTTEMLGDAFKNCAVNANAFGLDVEQTTALLGKLADQGLKGSEAGTALNAMFRDMIQKAENGAIAIGNTNVAVTDANGNFRDMADIVRDVQAATEGMSESERMAALMTTFTADSIKAMGILTSTGADAIDEFTESLYGAEGAAADMAETMNDTLQGDILKMKSALEAAAISIGEKLEPAIRKVVQWITKLITWFSNLPAPVLTVIMTIAGLLAVIGPLLLAFGAIGSTIIKVVNTFKMLKAAFAVFKGLKWVTNLMWFFKAPLTSIYVLITDMLIPALSSLWAFMLANPITFVIAAIAALVVAFIWLWKHCEGFREFWIGLWNKCKEAITNFYKENKQLFDNIIAAFKTLWDSLMKFGEGFLKFWKGVFTGDTETMLEGLKMMWEGFKNALIAIWDIIKNSLQIAWNGIKAIFEGNPIAENLIAMFEGMGQAIRDICGGLITFLKGIFTGDMQMAADGLRQIWEGVKLWFASIWDGIKNHLSMCWDSMKESASSFKDTIVEWFTVELPAKLDALKEWFAQLPEQIAYWLGYAIGTVIGWVVEMGLKAYEAGSTFINNVITWFQQLPGKIWTWLVNTKNKVIQWKNEIVQKAQEAGTQFLNKVSTTLQQLPGKVWQWLSNALSRAQQFVSQFPQKAQQAGSKFVSTIVNTLTGLPSKLYSLGVSAVQGLANGVMSMVQSVASAAQNLASSLMQGVKDALRIKSPSRRMRDEVGKMVTKGLIIGIEADASKAVETARNLANSIVQAVNIPEFQHSMNIGTQEISKTNLVQDNRDTQLMNELLFAIKGMKPEGIDYEQMADAFRRGAEKVDSPIYMDKTLVGRKTAPTVSKTNEAVKKRLNRLEGNFDDK